MGVAIVVIGPAALARAGCTGGGGQGGSRRMPQPARKLDVVILLPTYLGQLLADVGLHGPPPLGARLQWPRRGRHRLVCREWLGCRPGTDVVSAGTGSEG